MFAILQYRLFRLRRLIVVALIPTLAALAWVVGSLPQPELTVFVVIAMMPALHAVFYPGMWYETLSLSLACTATLLVAPFLEFSQSMVERWLWVALLGCMGMLLFCGVIWTVCKVLMSGPGRKVFNRTTAISSLDPATLKAGVTLYPGRDDERVSCGELSEDGIFEAVIHTQKLAPTPVDIEFEPMPDTAWIEEESGELHADMTLRCRIETSTDAEHHIIFHTGDASEPGISIFRFEEVAEGTRIEMIEHSQEVPFLIPLGMWLEDYFADYLLSEIERVEGRNPVSNRSRTVRQFVVDLAWLMKPFTWSEPPKT